MKIGLFLIQFLTICASHATEITPYKYDDAIPYYEIPASSQFMVNRPEVAAPDVISYFSPPKSDHYAIAILCGGSSSPQDIQSIIHFHRYFLQEFLDLRVGVITLEQRGVSGNKIDVKEFMEHYTRSNRLKDHQLVVNYLIKNPPEGWNGKFIFLGVSEGGPIVTALTEQHSDKTLATINWSGAVDWPWREQLWLFLQKFIADNPECPHQLKFQECKICSEHMTCRSDYDALMETALAIDLFI